MLQFLMLYSIKQFMLSLFQQTICDFNSSQLAGDYLVRICDPMLWFEFNLNFDSDVTS